MPTQDFRERRVVTILFSDLSGFTTMSEAMDPEDVTDLVDGLFRRFRPLIESRGGTVDKFIGDAVMAVFGAPAAHPDDPVRAIEAALAMQAEIARFNAERGTSLRMRIGLNTGEVLWGGVGGDRATATGDAVNVAQRLESKATPGTVFVSAATARLAGPRFRFASRGRVEVKGRQEPVAAMEAAEGVPGEREAPFTGRTEELGRLGGGDAFVVLVGEAGVGKSRLAAELRARAKAARPGLWVALGRAAGADTRPMAAFEEIARAEAGAADGTAIAARVSRDLEAAVPDPVARENAAHLVARSLGYRVEGTRVAGIEPARVAAEERLAWSLWIGARLPALLCVDDLHEAGASTRELMSFLARRFSGRGLSIVATSRPGCAPPEGFTELPLGPLRPGDALALATSILGGVPGTDLARFLEEQSGGNPCHLEQLCRFLVEDRLVAGTPLHLSAMPSLPHGLHGLLVARLDALNEGARQVLKGASAVGLVFWERVVATLLGSDLDAALEEASVRRMISPRSESALAGDAEFAFEHGLLREAAYSLVPKRDRVVLHARIAGILERLLPAGGRTLRALAALQRDLAGESAAAAAHWLEVAQGALAEGQVAEARGAAAEAARLGAGPRARLMAATALGHLARPDEALAEARAAIETGEGDLRFEASLVAAQSLREKSDFDGAMAELERALAVASGPAQRAAAELGRAWTAIRRGELAPAMDAADRAMAHGELPPETRAGALCVRAHVLRVQGRLDEALKALEEARELYRHHSHVTAQADVLGNIGIICKRQGRYEEALAALRESEDLLRKCGARRSLARTVGNLGNLYFWMRRHAEALEKAREAQAIFAEAGSADGVADCLINSGVILEGMGRLEEALAAQREALEISRRLGVRENVVLALGNIGNLCFAMGRVEESNAACEEAMGLAIRDGNRTVEALLLGQLGRNRHHRGDAAGAVDFLQRSIALKRASGDRPTLANTLDQLGTALVKAGRPADAVVAFRESATLTEDLGNPGAACERWLSCASSAGLAGDAAGRLEFLRIGLDLARRRGLEDWIGKFGEAAGPAR